MSMLGHAGLFMIHLFRCIKRLINLIFLLIFVVYGRGNVKANPKFVLEDEQVIEGRMEI